MTETAPKADTTTRTAERALTLLSVVCEKGSVTLGEAAKAADLSASTALRLLRTLESTNFVRRDDDGSYRPGATVVQLGVLALSQESLVALCRDPMTRIVEQTGESAYLSVPAPGRQGLYIAIVEGTHSVRHANWVGRKFPVESSASGSALQGEVGDHGYCVVSDGVERDVTAIATPIRVGERIVGALSVVVPSYRITPQNIDSIGRLLLIETHSLYN
ncbi:transcriptional regulator [Cryobacterium roopkundense]|uniref:Transcriptional regulator n=1 Tax=Cryobacterium roopkundense TaxID=1001240 RepID=A0A099J4I8_9MICO|nr:IclR family transcriptional regulator [Cryobacterium roopkundense]KGJ72378.1 transcriptional regulator [Cryobacterium roopkundense]MBB5642348.1 urocanate hydratase [Cryobacterium roopkundense]